MSISIAVVGATGLIGEALLSFLAEAALPDVDAVYALASPASAGKRIEYGDGRLKVMALSDFDFAKTQIAFFCVPKTVAGQWASTALAAGCSVIDWSDALSEQDGSETARYISAPSPLVHQLATVLRPLVKAAGLERLVVNAALAVSEQGRAGVKELAAQTARLLNVQNFKPDIFSAQIAFNVLPVAVDERDEQRLAQLLDSGKAPIQLSLMIAPVFFGHTAQAILTTKQPLSVEAAKALLDGIKEVELADPEEGLMTAVSHAANQDEIVVDDIHQSANLANTLALRLVGDNIRTGAALNGIKLAKILVKDLH